VADVSIESAQRLYDALKRITRYMQPAKLRIQANRLYGLSEDEAVEFAYENVLSEAKVAIHGMRRPAAKKVRQPKAEPMSQANAAAYHGDIDGDFDY